MGSSKKSGWSRHLEIANSLVLTTTLATQWADLKNSYMEQFLPTSKGSPKGLKNGNPKLRELEALQEERKESERSDGVWIKKNMTEISLLLSEFSLLLYTI